MRRLVQIVAMACLMAVGTTASIALAHNEEFKTTLTIKQSNSGATYKGRVKSDLKACRKNRLVTVYAEKGGTPKEIGTDRSNRRGKWRFSLLGDGYYAEVSEKVIDRGNHRHTCLFDRSPTTPFPSS